jgi:cytochrome c oxidase subunit 3
MAEGFLLFSLITILLGIIFLVIQYNEYINLLGSITNTVALSIFYLVTGFHGAHVFLGIVLIICTEIQIDLYDISTGNTLMISIALMY